MPKVNRDPDYDDDDCGDEKGKHRGRDCRRSGYEFVGRFFELYAEAVRRVQADAGNAGARARIERGARKFVNVKKIA